MNKVIKKAYGVFAVVLLAASGLLAQHSNAGESIYSDQEFDPIGKEAWYETPFLWVGLVMVVGVIVLFVLRSRRQRT